MLKRSLTALLKSHTSDSPLASRLGDSCRNKNTFPPSQAPDLAGDRQACSRGSIELKHERTFGLHSGSAAASGTSAPSSQSDPSTKRSGPRRMRTYTSTGNGQSSSSKSTSRAPITTARISKSSSQRRFGWKFYVLLLFALFIVGTFTVLRTVVHFFGVNEGDVISVEEVQAYKNVEALPYNAELTPSQATEEEMQLGLKREKIPRIIHQTWKSDILPEKWDIIRKDCMAMLPGFDFRLWTDAGSREFIATEYPSFLPTWDSYPYTIQRADAIRYFVLHKYGGIYMDLDIGCRAHPGPLLHFESILPITKPVGVSNDLMFSAPKTPFMDLVINSLETFNHQWLYMPYPTVMFSTGPMFISAIYSMWCRILQKGVGIDPAQNHLYQRVRILPKSLYGKNISPDDAPLSFYFHYYGSSWHAGDAGFIGFLGKYGYRILLLGSTVVFLGFCYLLWSKRRQILRSPRYRKVSLDPFEDLAVSPPIANDSYKQHLQIENDPAPSSIKSKLYSLTHLFNKSCEESVSKGSYVPLTTLAPSQQIRQRSNTGNSDSMQYDPGSPVSTATTSRLPASPDTPPPRRKPRVNPMANRPHSRQRSRDIERGSPIYRPSNAAAAPAEQETSWIWPDSATGDGEGSAGFPAGSSSPNNITQSQASVFSEPEGLTPPPAARDLPAMYVTGPSGQISADDLWDRTEYPGISKRPVNVRRQTDNSRSTPPSGTSTSIVGRPRSSSYQRPPMKSTSSQNGSDTGNPFNGRSARNNTRRASPPSQDATTSLTQSEALSRNRTSSNATNITDGEVSASELLDTLGDLEPVSSAGSSNLNNNGTSSATTRTGVTTPGERAKDAQMQAMRKRSLSSEGERFLR